MLLYCGIREIFAAPVMLCLVRYARSDKNAQLSSIAYIEHADLCDVESHL
jgi:hypothetical protein